MDPLQIFDNFKLDTLDEKWIDEVWEKEFLSFPEPPLEYSIILSSGDMEQFLRETCSSLKHWIAQYKENDELNSEERSEVTWQTITALNINIRGLLAVLGYLMKAGQIASADEDSRQACLASTSLYFVLLSIPGSSTFHVFHPNLYHRAVETMKLSELLIVCKRSPKSTDETMFSDESDEMSVSEKNTLTQGLNSILYELIIMLKTFYMKYQLRSLEITVINLVDLTKLETEVNHFASHGSRRKVTKDASITTLSYNAYAALLDLIEPRHGSEKVTIKLIVKYLMPHLCPHYLDLPMRAANVIWDTIICFLKNILHLKKSSADMSMEILIQHLLINCPDRSEPRQKQAGVIARLINICQGQLFLNCIQSLVLFSFHNKIPYRIFGQEVISKLLTENSFISEAEDEIKNRRKVKMVLIGTVQSRSIDVSSMVRGKSLSTIETLVNSEDFVVNDFVNMSEKDQAFPMPDDLLQALLEGTNPLPGSNTFICMLLERIKDERALVRRSTLHALHHLIVHFPQLLDEVAPILGQHCRDPALTVRRDAIHVLASLLESNPLNKTLLKEYIKCVPSRIYDVEVKVQEKVIESLQSLVLNKINTFNAEEEINEISNLPWNILKEMTKAKMRKNLSKICDIWVKNKVITDSIIGKIQSHVAKVHDEESWVLLLALAENMMLPNMKKYFENFKELLEDNTFVSFIKLEVLKYTWKSMIDEKYLESLCKQCFECLSKFSTPIESIGTCIDILDGIIKHLDKNDDDINLMVNLMRLSEAQIDLLDDNDEEVDDENIYTFLKAMSTLGHSSLLTSEDVTQSTLGIVQGLLLDCDDSIKMSDEQLKKFKAAGIVLLGQQALKDRDFAEQVVPIVGRLMINREDEDTLDECPLQSAIRINAVKILADLCVRFTALVEPYLPNMCVTMKDPNPMVRETVVVIFVQLLLEDYIKVKGAFFYHILTMLSDSDETIRELTIFLIKERLLAKNKLLISQSFIRSVFHYNNCQLRHKFNERKITKKEKEVLTLPGNQNENKRRVIYDFMLEHLDPPSKLKILTKLNSEIFEGICEKYINIKQREGACILKDVIYIISNDRMQASFGTKMLDDDMHEDVATAIETQTNNAVNVIAEGMKKFKLKVMTQTLIKLRKFLSENKSPLISDVSKFFGKILSELNKDQIAEVLDENPDLKKDIEHDIVTFKDVMDNNSDSESNEMEVKHDEVVHEIVDMNNTEVQHKVKDNPAEELLDTNESEKNIQLETPPKTPKSRPRKIHEIHLTGMPRIVLRRLSALTYPGVQSWKCPSHDATKLYQSSDPEPSSSGISVSSRSASDEMNTSSVDDLSDPELNSPKPNKISRLAESIADVQIS